MRRVGRPAEQQVDRGVAISRTPIGRSSPGPIGSAWSWIRPRRGLCIGSGDGTDRDDRARRRASTGHVGAVLLGLLAAIDRTRGIGLEQPPAQQLGGAGRRGTATDPGVLLKPPFQPPPHRQRQLLPRRCPGRRRRPALAHRVNTPVRIAGAHRSRSSLRRPWPRTGEVLRSSATTARAPQSPAARRRRRAIRAIQSERVGQLRGMVGVMSDPARLQPRGGVRPRRCRAPPRRAPPDRSPCKEPSLDVGQKPPESLMWKDLFCPQTGMTKAASARVVVRLRFHSADPRLL